MAATTMAERAREQVERIRAGETVIVQSDSYGLGYSEQDALFGALQDSGHFAGPEDFIVRALGQGRVSVALREGL